VLDEADCTVDVERRSSALLETVEFSEFEVLLVAVSAKTDKKTSVTFPHRVGAASTRISLRSLHQVSHFVQHACTGVRAVQRTSVLRSRDCRFESRPWLLYTRKTQPTSLRGRLMSISLCKWVTEVATRCGRGLIRRPSHLPAQKTEISTAPSATDCDT